MQLHRKLIWYVHFLTSCSHVCGRSVFWKVLENAFFESWKNLEFGLCTSWKVLENNVLMFEQTLKLLTQVQLEGAIKTVCVDGCISVICECNVTYPCVCVWQDPYHLEIEQDRTILEEETSVAIVFRQDETGLCLFLLSTEM